MDGTFYIRAFERKDAKAAAAIWNRVVEAGNAFPQTEPLCEESGIAFFEEQSYTAVAVRKEDETVAGLYILHPNNIGRCGHICNASYAVREDLRGNHIGEMLVRDCLARAGSLGFRILQFNAVVRSNTAALALYEKLGFVRLGVIPGGFLMKDGHYEDIVLHYYVLDTETNLL